MNRRVAWSLGCLLLLTRGGQASPTPAELAEEQVTQANREWQHRGSPGHTEAAIEHWKRAIQLDPSQPDVYIALTRACGRAYRHSTTDRDKQHWADEGRMYGALAIANNSQSSPAFAEYGAALGQWAEAHKGVHSLHAVRDAVENLKKSLTLDPHNAYAHMLLAEFYRQAPGWPVSVGNLKKSYTHAKLAVQYGNASAINHLILAKVYLSMNKKEDAKKELEIVLALTPPADAIPETRANQEDAREMLKNL